MGAESGSELDGYGDIIAKAYNGDPKLYRDVVKHFIEVNYYGDGRLNYKGRDRMAEGMQLVGSLKAPPDWKKLVDTQFLPQDLMHTHSHQKINKESPWISI